MRVLELIFGRGGVPNRVKRQEKEIEDIKVTNFHVYQLYLECELIVNKNIEFQIWLIIT